MQFTFSLLIWFILKFVLCSVTFLGVDVRGGDTQLSFAPGLKT